METMLATQARDDSALDVGLTTGALRAIMAAPGTGLGRAEDLARRLGDAIRVGVILDGERLPSEARLAAQLGVASVTLREVLRILRGEGLIATRRGHGGGTVVTAPERAESFATRLARLSLSEIRDLGDQRYAIFAAASELATARAVSRDLVHLRAHVERLSAGSDAGELRRADSLFTVEVAVAAQSPRLAREDLRLRAEVGDLLWMQPGREEIDRAVSLRTELVEAIAARDGLAARTAARAVIDQDTRRLVHSRLAARREAMPEAMVRSSPLTGVQEEMRRIFESLGRLAASFADLLDGSTPDGSLRRKDLSALRPEITETLEDHADALIGAGIVVRPGLLGDVDRWLEWLWTAQDGRLEPLRINLDPAAPDFYDYVAAEWYEHPLATGQPAIAGPYVDASCTSEYVLTLSVPVYHRGIFIGVVAADVPATVVESIVGGYATRSAAFDVLVSKDRRILVSLDERRLPGELLEPGDDQDLTVQVFEAASMETGP